jgi:hypothetical protein
MKSCSPVRPDGRHHHAHRHHPSLDIPMEVIEHASPLPLRLMNYLLIVFDVNTFRHSQIKIRDLTRMSRVVALAKFQAVTRDILQSYFFLSKLVED